MKNLYFLQLLLLFWLLSGCYSHVYMVLCDMELTYKFGQNELYP